MSVERKAEYKNDYLPFSTMGDAFALTPNPPKIHLIKKSIY